MLIASDVLVGSANSPIVDRSPVDSSMIRQADVIAAHAAKPMPGAVSGGGAMAGANFMSPTMDAELFRAQRGILPTPMRNRPSAQKDGSRPRSANAAR